MEYRQLGNSDLKVSSICLGCMGFGEATEGMHTWTLDEEASTKIIKYALEQGINFFDTAIAYQNGSSERYVGKALKQYAKREDVIIATKFLPRTPQAMAENVSVKQHIQQMLDKSLTNLGTDYVDLYIYHMWDPQMPIAEVMAA